MVFLQPPIRICLGHRLFACIVLSNSSGPTSSAQPKRTGDFPSRRIAPVGRFVRRLHEPGRRAGLPAKVNALVLIGM